MKKVLAGILLFAIVIGAAGYFSGNEPSNAAPANIENPLQSCHSTFQHKKALYSYDLDHDNVFSAYEMQLFIDAHPRIIQDKEFVIWIKSSIGEGRLIGDNAPIVLE